MYADFLDETALLVPEINTLGLPEMMKKAAHAWQALAAALYKVSEKALPDFSEVTDRLEYLIGIESAYHQKAVTLTRL